MCNRRQKSKINFEKFLQGQFSVNLLFNLECYWYTPSNTQFMSVIFHDVFVEASTSYSETHTLRKASCIGKQSLKTNTAKINLKKNNAI